MSSGVFGGENPPEDEDDDFLADALDEGGEEAPAPATWAGRQAWSGLPGDEDDEDEEDAAEYEQPPEDDAEGEIGLTEEFDVLEHGVEEDLEADIAGDDADAGEAEEDLEADIAGDDADAGEADEESALAEARADEGPEPGDEFDFAEDQGTVEADTLAAADQEEAREAALQGLRDRTAEHARKRGITPAPAAPAAAGEGGEDEKEQASGDAQEAPAEEEPGEEAPAEEERAEEAAAVAATAGAPPDEGDPTPDERLPGSGMWPRFMAATFLIVASLGAATAVSVLVYLTDIAKGLGGLPGLQGQLTEVGDQKAQNFLIIGSDVRPDQSNKGLSDTTMLLRVDPENAITQLSIPRDLRVNIPGHGIDKFNTAYSYGGPKLTLQVVKQLTDNRIPINHVVNVDFNGFADAVDAIGCVHVDVDRHYFNDNAMAASLEDQYAEINIEAGYQRLCGFKALQYVRYRHEDNDIVRAARQQGFLREARQKVPPGKLLDDRDKLIDIFTKYTSSDINDSGTLVELFKLMIDARNAQIAQIEFPYDSLDAEGYVTAGDEPLREAVSEFLGERPLGGEEPAESEGGGGGDAGPEKKPEDKPKPKPKPEPEPERSPEQIAASQMIDATAAAQTQAAAILQEGGKDLKFPVLYPTLIVPSANAMISDDSRYLGIDGNGKLYHGYKFVMTMQGTSYPTAYYGVSGTNWVDAPLFENPSERRKIGEREYLFYRDAGQLRMLAFERKGTMYWVSNTLDKLLSEPQMIAIAQNLREVGS